MEPAAARPLYEVIDHDDLLVHEWRVTQLIRPGIPGSLAQTAAGQVDWHQVAKLMRRGRSPRLALHALTMREALGRGCLDAVLPAAAWHDQGPGSGWQQFGQDVFPGGLVAMRSARVLLHGGDQVIELVAASDPEFDAARRAGHPRSG